MEFSEKIDHWKQLFKTKREEADQFYFNSMFEDVINRFLPKSKGLEKYRFLISLLGFSPQPVILFIRAIKPEKVLFVHSEETESYLDVIQQWTGLKLAQVVKEQVDSSDPTDVYKAIKEFVVSRNPREILLDITGGKKAMVGGAAMAGNLLGIDTGYVDNERYLPDLRQPEPGSEYPNILKNPFYVLGDIELEKAKEAFNQCNFSRCLDILNCLEERIEDIWGIRKFKSLAEAYIEIDAFNFSKALVLIEEFLKKYSEDRRLIEIEKVQATRNVLSVLVNKEHPDYVPYCCINYYFSGDRFGERSLFDVAVFMMYRTIEMILAFTLEEIGIDPSNPIYPKEVTMATFNRKLKEVFEKDYYEKDLPRKVGLMDSAIVLSIMNHPIMETLSLNELKGMINLRNESRFTHGFRPLGSNDFSRIKRLTRKLLEKYLSLKGKPMVNGYMSLFAFPKINL
jgi:CRISPR-associated protein (TIGR02710 family)